MTALPQPKSTSTIVPISSALYFFIGEICGTAGGGEGTSVKVFSASLIILSLLFCNWLSGFLSKLNNGFHQESAKTEKLLRGFR
jgi:hypothetical protein